MALVTIKQDGMIFNFRGVSYNKKAAKMEACAYALTELVKGETFAETVEVYIFFKIAHPELRTKRSGLVHKKQNTPIFRPEVRI